MTGAAILGVEGFTLSGRERALFRAADPFGFILFGRNIEDPDQLRRLTASLRDCVGRDAPILIDQEGGRVQRLKPPQWRSYLPALDQMGRARDPLRAQWVRNRLIAAELLDVGIDVNCAPLGDIAEDATHPVLRNRLYGDEPLTVIAAARACADGLLAGGVLPVLKHIPGHGRARVDSHLTLPRVTASRESLEARDFAPFRALRDLPMAMTAHVVFEAINPNRPATTSPMMIRLIRDEIGFDGLLMSDDIGMEALSGTPGDRAAAAIVAGCDLALHCNGDADAMDAVVAAVGSMTHAAQARGDRALAMRRAPDPVDVAALVEELADLVPDSV